VGRFVTRSWLLAPPLAVTLVACGDHQAKLFGPQHPLAVGAYHSLAFGDACAGPPGYVFCTTELVTQLLESGSDDPTVADVIAGKDHPQGDLALHDYYVLGKKPGETSLVFKGMFDDGSVREDRISVRVESPDTLRVATGCGVTPSTNVLVNVGNDDGFSLEMLAGKDQLDGWLPGALTADGLTDVFNDDDRIFYDWQAPATPTVVQPQTSIAAKVDGTLTAYDPDQVTEIDLTSSNTLPATFLEPGNFYLSTQVHVHGQTPCSGHGLPVELHSSTPAICSGPSGEAVWEDDSEFGGQAVVHAEGQCVLAAGMPGGPTLTTQTFPIFFVQPPPGGIATPGFLGPCPTEGATACAGGNGQIGVCEAGHWAVKTECPDGQACDYVPDSTPGCVAGAACARCRGLR